MTALDDEAVSEGERLLATKNATGGLIWITMYAEQLIAAARENLTLREWKSAAELSATGAQIVVRNLRAEVERMRDAIRNKERLELEALAELDESRAEVERLTRELAEAVEEGKKAERLWKSEAIRAERAENTRDGLQRAGEILLTRAESAEAALAEAKKKNTELTVALRNVIAFSHDKETIKAESALVFRKED